MTTTTWPAAARPQLPRYRARLQGYTLLLVVGIVLWVFVLSPMLLTVLRSFDSANPSAYASWTRAVPAALLGSVIISLLSVVTAGVTGIVLAVLLHRWQFPLRRLFHVLALTPLALPPFIGTAAFAKLYGFGGLVPSFLGLHILGVDPNTLAVDGVIGVLLVHTVTMYPYFYLPVSAALRNMDASLEDAAGSLGASPLQTWIRIVLPMLTPAIVSGVLLTFMSSMGSYTAPVLFGVNDVLTRQIALANDNADLAFASAGSVVLCLFSIAFLLAFRSYERRSAYWTNAKGGARRRETRIGRGWQWLLLTTNLAITSFVMLPMVLIALLAFSVDGTWREGLLPADFGMQNIAALCSTSSAWAPVVNSLQMSAAAAVAATLLGVCCAYIVARFQTRGRLSFEIAIMLPWALPGTVVAFNLIAAFNSPSGMMMGHTLIGTWAMVPLAYFVRFSPMVFRSTAASLAELDPSLEEASRSLGASPWYTFRHVVFPLLSRGIASGALLAFVGGIGEFVSTILLHSQARYKPLSIAIADEYYRGNFGTASAWGVLQILIVLVVLIAARRMEANDCEARQPVG